MSERLPICDTHVHVVGDPAQHPQAADRTYTAGPAPLASLLAVAEPEDVRRFVIVQPSFYGTDNSVTLGAVAALGGRGRGVAVVDPAHTTPTTLQRLAEGGIVGVRLNLYSTLAEQRGLSLEAEFGALTALAARQGWHVQLIARAPVLVAHAALIAASPVPIVIDHYGVHDGVAVGSETGQALLRLLGQPHVWCKLSAPYRNSADPLATRPDPDWLAAILHVAAPRCVWGSDWPHTAPHGQQTGAGIALPYRALRYADVVAGLRDSLPGALVDPVLRTNPARLYGFGDR